jgi:diguanylate cyclase (GGDEF)-like protein
VDLTGFNISENTRPALSLFSLESPSEAATPEQSGMALFGTRAEFATTPAPETSIEKPPVAIAREPFLQAAPMSPGGANTPSDRLSTIFHELVESALQQRLHGLVEGLAGRMEARVTEIEGAALSQMEQHMAGAVALQNETLEKRASELALSQQAALEEGIGRYLASQEETARRTHDEMVEATFHSLSEGMTRTTAATNERLQQQAEEIALAARTNLWQTVQEELPAIERNVHVRSQAQAEQAVAACMAEMNQRLPQQVTDVEQSAKQRMDSLVDEGLNRFTSELTARCEQLQAESRARIEQQAQDVWKQASQAFLRHIVSELNQKKQSWIQQAEGDLERLASQNLTSTRRHLTQLLKNLGASLLEQACDGERSSLLLLLRIRKSRRKLRVSLKRTSALSRGEIMTAIIGGMLKNVPFFRRLSEELLEELAEIGKSERHQANTTIFSEGDSPDCLYLILSGSVQLRKTLPDGQQVGLARLQTGDFFGEMALIDGAPRSATATTLERCELYAITRDKFTELLSQSPQVIPAVMASVVNKARTFSEQFLLELCEKQKLREEVAQERYRSIARIAAEANEATTTEEAMQIVVDRICEYGHWSVGHVYVSDEHQKGSLFSSSVWHVEAPQVFEPFKQVSEMTRFSADVGLPGRVLVKQKPIWVEDVTLNASCPRAIAAEQTGLKSGFGFPVLVDKEVAAVLEFFSDTPREADRLLLDATVQIGAQLGRLIERKQFERQLFYNAFHDSLTDLPNRSLFLDRLGQAVARAKRNGNYLFAVLFVDLDRFKLVNDSMGHQAGDQLLLEIGRRIRNCVRATDTVARLGGDEFGILLEDFQHWSDVPRAVERVRTELQSPISLRGREVFTTASIGIALSSTGYEEIEAPLRDADIAMYRAKSEGPGRYVVFDPSMHKHAVKRLQLENDLWRAIDRGELRLHYQPIVALATGWVSGFEGLIRWQHPERGLLSPGEFLPIAEETELIIPITEWVLEEACRQVREWLETGAAKQPLSVNTNLSARYLSKLELHERIGALLSKHGLDTSCLKLEITEGQILKDPASIGRTLARLSDAGIQVHIDDFGTGYSSLGYLSSLRVHGLKIDQSFTGKLGKDRRNDAIVRSIISLGKNLELDVIAEGVETAEQADCLRKMSCLYVQGFHMARPMEPQAAARLLRSRTIEPGRLEPVALAL